MKLVLKFKDGMNAQVDLGDDFTIEGTGNFFELIRQGKENNGDIEFNDINRKYDDLYSLEIIL